MAIYTLKIDGGIPTGNTALHFQDDQGTPVVTALCIGQNRVGIGSTSPSTKFDVAGDALLIGDDGWVSDGDEAILSLGDTNHQVKAVNGGGGPSVSEIVSVFPVELN